MDYRLDQHTSDREAQLSPKTGLLHTPLSSCHSTRGSWYNINSPQRARESERVENRLLRQDTLKKIHIHNMGGIVADLSAMMKITRPCGKCWDVTCLLYFTEFLHLLVYFVWTPFLLVSLSSPAWSFFSISLSLWIFSPPHCLCSYVDKKNKSREGRHKTYMCLFMPQ